MSKLFIEATTLISLADSIRGLNAKAWVKVNFADLQDGDIIAITSDDAGDINYLLNASTTSTTTSRPSADVVTLTDGKLTDVDTVYQLTVEKAEDGIYLKNAEGVYMTWTSGTAVNFTGTAQNAALVHWDSAAGAQGLMYTDADAAYPVRYLAVMMSTAIGNPMSWRAYDSRQAEQYENETVTIWRYNLLTMQEMADEINAAIAASKEQADLIAQIDEILKTKSVDLGTSDATATAEDILQGKTAYARGEKVVGTLRIPSGISYWEGILTPDEDGDLIFSELDFTPRTIVVSSVYRTYEFDDGSGYAYAGFLCTAFYDDEEGCWFEVIPTQTSGVLQLAENSHISSEREIYRDSQGAYHFSLKNRGEEIPTDSDGMSPPELEFKCRVFG